MILLSTSVLERFPQPVFLVDECGRVRHVNDRACRTLGYEAPELYGLLFAELDVSLPVGEWEYFRRRVLAGNTARAEEHLFLTRGGTVVRMEVEASRHEGDGGSFVLLQAKHCQRRSQSAGQSDQRLRFLALLETIPGIVVRFDAGQRVGYASRELERQLEVAPGALFGGALNAASPSWIHPLRDAAAWVLQTGEPREVVLDATLPAGRLMEKLHVLPLHNARGEIDGVLAYAESAAERLLREATIHNTEEPYREIFQAAMDGLFLLDAAEDGRFMVVDVNPAFARFVGRSRGELAGRYLDEIMPSDHVKSHTAKFRRCMEAADRIEETGRLQAATGLLWYGSVLMPVRDEEGLVRGIAGIFRDVAENMHMKAALQESEQRYREVVERSTDSIFVLEVTADRHFRALAANRSFEMAFGIRREEAIGRLVEEIVPRPLAELLTARYAAVVESGNARDDELELELPAGRFFVRSSLVPMKDSAGNVRRIMVIAREQPLATGAAGKARTACPAAALS